MNLPKLRYIILPCTAVILASCNHRDHKPNTFQQPPVDQPQIYLQKIGQIKENIVLISPPQDLHRADNASSISPTPITYSIIYSDTNKSSKCNISTWNNEGKKISDSKVAGITYSMDSTKNTIMQISCDKETSFKVTTTFSIFGKHYDGSSDIKINKP